MRIAHVTTVHSSDDPRIFERECITLLNENYRVHVVCSQLPKHADNRLCYHIIGKHRSRIGRILIGVPKAFILSLRSGAKIIHIHDLELLPLAPFWRIFGKRVIYDIHENYITSIKQKDYLPPYVRLPLAALLGALEHIFAICCWKIIAEKYYAERFPDGVTVLNYPILKERNSYLSSSTICLKKDHHWCLYTGVISSARGAFNHVRMLKHNSEIGLCMIGRCNVHTYNYLLAKIDELGINRERLVIIGENRYVPKEEMDLIVQTNKWLAGLAVFPETEHYTRKDLTKLFDYMRYGIPIIASNFPTWVELIEECKSGLNVSPDKVDEITGSINWLIENPEKARIMGENGNLMVRQKYNWKSEGEKLITLYKKILGDGKN
ncbi:MAG: glycosyltransferase [Smithellaceae bacterium]|jgi:glycosyltransferase involved in cell wall biosynthesis